MAQHSVEGIDTTVQETNRWLAEIADELHTDDRQRAYLSLRAVLHALRDQFTVDEAAQFGAQLPMLVTGIYYEGWKPSKTPQRLRDRDAFLRRVQEEASFAAEMDPQRTVESTARVVSRHLSRGQLEESYGTLPSDIRQMFATEGARAGGG